VGVFDTSLPAQIQIAMRFSWLCLGDDSGRPPILFLVSIGGPILSAFVGRLGGHSLC